LDGVPEAARNVVAASDGDERQERGVTLASESGLGPTLGLRVGVADGPAANAVARADIPSREWSRIGHN
jgi:hypothetical protein